MDRFGKALRYAWGLINNEHGFWDLLLQLAMGATVAQNLAARGQAAQTLEEDIETPAQTTGSVIQGFADRGLVIGPESPAVQESLRRRSLAKRQAQAQQTLAGPSPWETLFGMFAQR